MMKSKVFILCFTILLIFCQFVSAQQQRGVRVVRTSSNGAKQEVQLYEGSYALVIGNSEYTSGWNRLSGVKSDVVAVRRVLEKHGFKVETEENLTSERFEARIRKFINDYGYDRDNRLIIYYAGHGHTLKSAGDKRELGYIIPSDTPLPDKDERGFRQKAVSMYTIQTFAKEIQAKHALFVFDSCFSGKLFALRDAMKITPFIYDKVDNPVRQFITAGDETQSVPDESIFRKAFVRGLEGDADRNNDSYITGTELADYLKESVTNYSERRQTPQYGLINDIDLDKGDFVFVKPKICDNNAVAQNLARRSLDKLTFGDFDEAQRLAQESLNVCSETPLALVVNGFIEFMVAGKELAFLDATKVAFELEPQNQLFKVFATKTPLEMNDKAISEIFDNPQNYEEFLVRAFLYSKFGSFDSRFANKTKIIEDLKTSIRLNPNCVTCKIMKLSASNFGELEKDKSLIDSAISDINAIIKMNPKFPFSYFVRARLFSFNKQYSQALADYSKVIELNPRYKVYAVVGYEARANVYEEMGRKDLAQLDREMAEKLKNQQFK